MTSLNPWYCIIVSALIKANLAQFALDGSRILFRIWNTAWTRRHLLHLVQPANHIPGLQLGQGHNTTATPAASMRQQQQEQHCCVQKQPTQPTREPSPQPSNSPSIQPSADPSLQPSSSPVMVWRRQCGRQTRVMPTTRATAARRLTSWRTFNPPVWSCPVELRSDLRNTGRQVYLGFLSAAISYNLTIFCRQFIEGARVSGDYNSAGRSRLMRRIV